MFRSTSHRRWDFLPPFTPGLERSGSPYGEQKKWRKVLVTFLDIWSSRRRRVWRTNLWTSSFWDLKGFWVSANATEWDWCCVWNGQEAKSTGLQTRTLKRTPCDQKRYLEHSGDEKRLLRSDWGCRVSGQECDLSCDTDFVWNDQKCAIKPGHWEIIFAIRRGRNVFAISGTAWKWKNTLCDQIDAVWFVMVLRLFSGSVQDIEKHCLRSEEVFGMSGTVQPKDGISVRGYWVSERDYDSR